ncbi:DUF4124 domain-containing protein [Colwellia sp. BRX10-3]|uniref:DUF4124 domain-containing protein n=1 Tax=Colwellia sp. BRX10-3 TaxID=2759844 RepID=UPI0015F46899|nr:DUF4124 domain-containing protein [Colwellia sp. BRX10-3]MBA6391641.1 DUF4124 domain-containing protein [Colwellia sp. BRX10-3]
MNIKALSLFLVILVYFDVSAAEQLTVYRWVDKENVVHFSQHQPDHDDYIEISMANNKKSSTIIDKANAPESYKISNNNFSDGNAKTDLDNELNDGKCVTARENINTLQNFDNIQYKDEKGNVRILTALDKQQQLEMNNKQAEVYCTN